MTIPVVESNGIILKIERYCSEKTLTKQQKMLKNNVGTHKKVKKYFFATI